MKKFLKVIGVILVVLVVCGAGMFVYMGKVSSDAMKNQVNNEIDMNKIADGVYEGRSDGGMVKVKVAVEVNNHKIKNIDLIEHQNGKGKPAESMLDKMVEKDTYDVDGVSGATASSKTIKNAVNVALYKGMK